MAAILHMLDQRRLIDSNGIADRASIYFYTTGTLTPTPVYTTAALNVEHPSPIVVEAGAAVPDIYLDDSVTYRRRIVYPDGSVDDSDPYDGGIIDPVTLAATYATKAGPAFTGAASFTTNGSRIGITDAGSPITPNSALMEVRGNGVNTLGLRVSQRWTGTTAAPYQNNDTTLFETFNNIVSNSTNYSWSVSAPNGYNNIPAGVTDSGYRLGVYGWAVSVHVPGSYEHAGTLALQVGVRGRAGFQGTGSTGTVTEAIGVNGEIYNDSSGATIVHGVGVQATSNAVDGPVQNAYAVRAFAANGTVTNWAFHGDAGLFFNQDKLLVDSKFTEFDSHICTRGVGTTIEFGFPGSGGYGSGLGATRTSGHPFIAFGAENETGDTFTTTGKRGFVIRSADGVLVFSRVPDPNTADQAIVEAAQFDLDGRMQFSLAPNSNAGYRVSGIAVVGAQQAAIADAVGGDEVAKINAILAALRGHGLIAS